MHDGTPKSHVEAPAPKSIPRARSGAQWRSVLLAAIGTLSITFIGGLGFKALLPSPSSTYPLASFNQSPNLNVRQFPGNPPRLPTEVPPATLAERSRSWEVYFDHGKAIVGADQIRWLTRLAELHSECDTLKLTITGVVSSASYPPPSADEKNLQLARARAASVRQVVAGIAPKAILVEHTWADYPSVNTRRYFRDLRREVRVENAAEFLNRRVDIELSPESKRLSKSRIDGQRQRARYGS